MNEPLTPAELAAAYGRYIDCLNRQDWAELPQHLDPDVEHNGMRLGADGYRRMLERDYREIPDLAFNIGLLVCEPPHVAARLDFHCTPVATFLGLPVDGRTVSFAENVFYRFRAGRIAVVWSIIDKTAVERQLAG